MNLMSPESQIAHQGPLFGPRTYFLIFLALIVLTMLTVALSFFELGPWHLVAGMAIGVVKAVLVILFFMHVLHSSRLTWLVIAAGFFWLVLLIGGTIADYLTRPWLSY
jgi:cytochrome c oxidase subunit IV